MPNVRHIWFIIMLLAVSAFARTASAQEKDEERVAQDRNCLDECSKKMLICASRVNVREACRDIPSCEGLTDDDIRSLSNFCDSCRTGGLDCSKPEITPAPPAPPTPSVSPKSTRPAPPLTEEQLCRKLGGVMVDVVVSEGVTKKECMTILELYKQLQELNEKVKELNRHRKIHAAEILVIKAKLDALEHADGLPQGARNYIDIVIKRELIEVNRRLRDIDESLLMLTENDRSIKVRQDVADVRLDGLEKRATSTWFAFRINVAGNIHARSPFDHRPFAVGPELIWLPAITPNVRMLAGIGGGYAGNTFDDKQWMKAFWAVLGFQPKLSESWHLPLGGILERRFNEFDTTKAASYGGFLEPTWCPGDDGPYKGLRTADGKPGVPLHVPHRFCIGVRAALQALVVQDPRDQSLTVLPDGSFWLAAGYAFLP